MKIDKKAMEESVTDTMLGAAFNFPISWATLAICLAFTTDSLKIAVIQLIVLTLAAIIRRYYTRLYFKNKE